MKIYDISQELFSSRLFPGDAAPTVERISQIKKGDICTVTTMHISAHHGTHVDAPCHFIEDGKTIDQLELSKFVGEAKVVTVSGVLTAADVDALLVNLPKKLLLRGDVELSTDAATAFVRHGVELIGIESPSIAPVADPQPVHMILLGAGVIALEGLNLQDVPDGDYFLSALPLKLAGSDGSPCRAVLFEW